MFRVQVDLRAVVDLLSHHLYSSPDVYVRELLQNAVDAVAARRLHDPAYAGSIVVEVAGSDDPVLMVEDDGIGLTEEQIHTFLATVGRSTKRDALDLARNEFLGQFGVGLLSCFLVADEIVVITRSVDGGPTFQWRGRSDGSYDVTRTADRAGPGSTVFVRPRRDEARRVAPAAILDLVRRYAGLLGQPVEVRVDGRTETVGGRPLPWQDATGELDDDRRAALLGWGEQRFGERFLDVAVLRVPVSETTGVAFIAAEPRSPGARQRSLVTLKGMLLSDSVDQLLPDWAFFARCAVDTRGLHPTASRESLVEDDLLDETREALGGQLRRWILDLASREPARLRAFVALHQLSLKALAVHDDELYAAIVDCLPVETSAGVLTLGELARLPGPIRYTPSLDVYRQLLQVSAAQSICLVNGGYTYDGELIRRLPVAFPEVTVEEVTPDELVSELTEVGAGEIAAATALAVAGNAVLSPYGCEVFLKRFRPRSVPVLLVVDPDASFRRLTRRTRQVTQGLWTDVVSGVESLTPDRPTQLCLNVDNDVVRAMLRDPAGRRTAAGLQLLYVQALLMGHHALEAREMRLLSTAVLGLLGGEDGS